MTTYVLPDLQYDYGALEPHISARIMQLHHDKHHKTYVDGANQALEQLEEARTRGDFGRIAAVEQALAFNLSGHVLHSIFWCNLSPDGGGKPSGELASAIDRDFGGFDHFKQQLTKAAATCMGSGWGALTWDSLAGRLLTVQIHDHQSHTIQGGLPLLVIDAWEHAYYLQYQNEKAKFFDAVWNVWNWKDVAERFERARAFELLGSGSGQSGQRTQKRPQPQAPAGRA
ncbi:MAG TPA: superoxide dismutase [Steroidobacteraceae bacterium]|nr:superoxide dismutase [Steroidobacteraceae bacterium]